MRKIFLVTGYSCNNFCISCAKKPEEKGFLKLGEIKKRLEKINLGKEDSVEISGGEPTIRPDLFELVEYIKKTGARVIVLTNGRVNENIEYCKKLKEAGVDRIATSFYSHKERIHEEITQVKGSFKETFEGIKNLLKIEIPVSVKLIILKQNYKEIKEFVKFAYDNFPGAWVSVHGLIMRGKAYLVREKIGAKYSEIKPYLEKALDYSISRGKNLGVFIFPTCVLDPYYWKYLGKGWKKIIHEMIYISPEETIIGNLDSGCPNYCKDCEVNNNCSWAWESAWKEYTQLYGTSELKKIKFDKYRIQKATKEDTKQLSEYMLRELENPNKSFPNSMIEKFRKNAQVKNMEKQFDNPNLIGYTLKDRGKLIGFIVGYREDNEKAMIHYITSIKLQFRKNLLEYFIKECKKRGLKKIRADSFEFMDSNQFFINSNFKFIGKEELVPGLEMLWYEMEIN
jgi:MoaA/NifB/PqqE/SkfB family radical SAM enzyme